MNSEIVSANYMEGDFGDNGDYGDQFLSANTAASGSYTVESHNPQELTVLRKNEGHYGGFAENAPDVVRLSYALEPTTLRALMPRGEHDVTRMQLPVEILQALDKDPNISLARDLGGAAFYIKLNMQRPPTDDVHFRKAIALAFDYETMYTLLQVTDDVSAGAPANGPVPRGVVGYSADNVVPRSGSRSRQGSARQVEVRPQRASLRDPVGCRGALLWRYRADLPAEHGGHRNRRGSGSFTVGAPP